MRRAMATLSLVIAVVMPAACGGGSGADAYGVVTRAAADTAQAAPARMAMRMTVRGLTLSGAGTVDLRTKTASIEMGVPRLGQLKVVTVGGMNYMQLGDAARKAMGVATPWVKIDGTRAQSAVTGVTGGATDQDASDTLALLTAASKDGVTTVGHESLRGAATTHYRADVDLATAVKRRGTVTDQATFDRYIQKFGSKPIKIDVWIGDDGLVRQFAMDLTVGSVTETITTEIYDFGKVEAPTPPSDDQVTDITDRVIAQAHAGATTTTAPSS